MPSLKPIDTEYAGHLFRSSLEARWAMFFDLLGIKWEYEPEGYLLPSGTRYSPDFLIQAPEGKQRWIEVKRDDVSDDKKFSEFSEVCDGNAVLVTGRPLLWLEERNDFCPRCGMPLKDDGAYRDKYKYCFPCDRETGSGGGHAPENGVLGIEFYPHKGDIVLTENSIDVWPQILLRAARKVNKVRFGHGEIHERLKPMENLQLNVVRR